MVSSRPSRPIGALRLVRVGFSFPLEIDRGPDDARFSAELDGGALMDLGCYCISAIRLVAGEPASLAGKQVVVYPDEYKTGDVITPFEKARTAK